MCFFCFITALFLVECAENTRDHEIFKIYPTFVFKELRKKLHK